MNKLFAIALLLFASIPLSSQSISPEVIASAGDVYLIQNGPRLSWTMGESAVETYPIGNTRLTLGFHQMYVQPMSVPTTEASPLAGLVYVWPNPTSGFLQVENLSGQTLSVVALDLAGRSVFEAQNIDSQAYFDFTGFPSGNYLLQFFSKNEPVSTFKIVKQ